MRVDHVRHPVKLPSESWMLNVSCMIELVDFEVHVFVHYDNARSNAKCIKCGDSSGYGSLKVII